MKRLSIFAVLLASITGLFQAEGRDVHVYSFDKDLHNSISDARRIEFNGDQISVVTNDNTTHVYNAPDVGFLSFSAKTPTAADVVNAADCSLNVEVYGLSVVVSNLRCDSEVALYDPMGRVVAQTNATSDCVQLTAESAGIYFVNVKTHNDSQTSKIVLK